MNEFVLHYVWKFSLFDPRFVYSVCGKKITISKVGSYNNKNAGPDFIGAEILVDNLKLFGSIEIHQKSTDYFLHQHHHNKFYQQVILHVVFEHNLKDRTTIDNMLIIELKSIVPAEIWSNIHHLISSSEKLPCEFVFPKLDSLFLFGFQDRLVVERFQRKVQQIEKSYLLNNKQWEPVLYQLLCTYLFGHVNKEAVLILCSLLPLPILKKHKGDLIALEAIVFGVAGFLEKEYIDLYPNLLKREFQYYRYKYKLETMEVHWWQWLRLRPAAFPTIKLAQFCSIINQNNLILGILSCEMKFSSFSDLFKNVELSKYWQNHYRFDEVCKNRHALKIGKALRLSLYINVFLPVKLCSSQIKGLDQHSEIIDHLLDLPSEKNYVIDQWKQKQMNVRNAFESQAMIELHKEYCSRKKCLNCNIGLKSIKQVK